MSPEMEMLLQRQPTVDGVTHGDLIVDGKWAVFTLEDAIRHGPKIAHETAIPAGRYEVTITRSQHFGRMLPLLLDVPGFEGIRIHTGNTRADTSGCILVGLARAHDSIASSQIALSMVQPKIAGAIARGERVWLTVLDPSMAAPVLNV